MNTSAYLLLRLAIGTSLFGHGLVRLPKLEAFSHWMTGSFEKSMLPAMLVTPFSYILPIAEFTIGLLLLLGLLTQTAIIVGSLMMIALILGTTLLENWDALPSQLIHVAILAVLLHFVASNSMSLDHFLKK